MEQQIRRSNLFDSLYYKRQYKLHTSANTVRHYLSEGANAGYSPNEWFDTGWYKANYEDVRLSGVNPFVHYIQNGRKEGRATNRIQFHSQEINGLGADKEHIVQMLWRGLSQSSLRQLKELYSNASIDESVRFFAIWHTARWFYFIGEFEQALSLSQLAIEEFSPKIFGKTGVLMHAFCLQKNGEKFESEKFIRSYYPDDNFDEDILLTLTNCSDSAKKKLSFLNQIYHRHGLTGLTLKHEHEELSLDNLTPAEGQLNCENGALVSVIVPCFNAEETIKTALCSLVEQSWANLEIIVVDDCSTDETVLVVEKLSAEYPQIKLVKQTKNSGAYCARNVGLSLARGSFITTHDADDWSHPQKIQLQMEYLFENKAVVGVCTQWVRVTSKLNFEHNWRLNPRLIHWSHSSFLFRRRVFEELGYWDAVLAGGDTEYIWRVESHFGFNSVKKIHSQIPLAFALDDENSLTRNKATHIKTMYHGMRHIYRSACQWWHSQDSADLYMDIKEKRKFPAPPTMISKDHYNMSGDVVLISDFCEGSQSVETYESISALMRDGKKVFLYHLPRPYEKQGQLSSLFFDLLSNSNADACVFGMTLSVDCVCLLAPELLLEAQEELVTLFSNTVIINANQEQKPNVEMALSLVTANEPIEVKTTDSLDFLLEYLKDKKS
jgi:glycosyltransferase involved in cell wall biosynthesis